MRRGVLLFAILAAVAGRSEAQTVNPTRLDFIASTDHDAAQGGEALLTGYEARWYAAGATAPQSVTFLGKPTPDPATRRIAVDVTSTILAIPIGTGYTCRVVAIGPGGEGVSDPSAPFGVAYRTPTAPTSVNLAR